MAVVQVTGPTLLPPPVCQNTLAFALAEKRAEELRVSRRPRKKRRKR